MTRENGTQNRGLLAGFSPLAGVSAGAMGVLVVGAVVLIACRRQLSEVASVFAWTLMLAVPFAAFAAAVFVVMWLRHRARNPELLVRGADRVQVLDAEPAPEPAPEPVAAAEPAAIEPPRVYLNVTDDQLEALMRRHAEEQS